MLRFSSSYKPPVIFGVLFSSNTFVYLHTTLPPLESWLCTKEMHERLCRLLAHRRVSRFPATVRGRQSGHFLETASLTLPPAALRRFPPWSSGDVQKKELLSSKRLPLPCGLLPFQGSAWLPRKQRGNSGGLYEDFGNLFFCVGFRRLTPGP